LGSLFRELSQPKAARLACDPPTRSHAHFPHLTGVKLSVNFVDRGRYWKAGESISDERVTAMIRKYALAMMSRQLSGFRA
jgi:hypothetical protein